MDKLIFILAVAATAIVGLLTISRLTQAKTQRIILEKMLDRFSSASDLSIFLQSHSGRDWISSLTDRAYDPVSTIRYSVRAGILCCFLGAGCFMPTVRSLEDGFPAGAVGTILIFLGIGFLASALASFLLSVKYRLLPGRDDPSR
jgi:hypothetical protein